MTENNSSNENKMGTMPVGRLLFSMSLPAMFSMLIHALYNIVDSIFVSMIGQQALAAVSLIFPVQMLIVAVGVGTGVGLNSLISRRLGERRTEEANSAASHGLLLAFISWLLFAVFGLFFSGPFVKAFTDIPFVISSGVSYCAIVTIFSLFPLTQMITEKIMQATGNMILPMISNLVGAVINIILDPILIFGLLGAPKLGVAGAAWATIIGQFFGMLLSLTFIFFLKHDVKVALRGFHLNFSTIKNIYAVGFPSIMMQAMGSIMLTGLNGILITFSDAAVAVLGVYYKLQSFIFMPVFGLNQGTMPILGYNFGAKNKDRLMHAFKLSLLVAVLIMTLGTLLFQTLPKELMELFNASPEMLEIGIQALRLISLSFIPAALGIIGATLFQATGHGNASLMISLLRQLILILPLAWILSHLFGLKYFWLAFPLAELFAVIATILIFQWVYRKEIHHLGE